MDFRWPCQLTRQFRSLTLRKSVLHRSSPSARPPVRPSACLSTIRPCPLVRLSTPLNSFARPPVRALEFVFPSACPPVRSETSSACASVHLPVRPIPRRSPFPAPSTSFHPWSLAYKLLAVEAEHALFV